ncbi:response regulator [Microbacterium oxydans]|nr:response regulator [Microbacterium oxydans]
MKIMLVDDDAEIRLGFTTALRRRGHTVETAEDVASARLLAERTTPDVAIIDVMLPRRRRVLAVPGDPGALGLPHRDADRP